jgi:hypothetical protein
MMGDLTYWERNPPYAAVGFARLLGTSLRHAADPKGTNKTTVALRFAGGCGRRASLATRSDCPGSCGAPAHPAAAALRSLHVPDCRDELQGPAILRFLSRQAAAEGKDALYGQDPLAAAQVRL